MSESDATRAFTVDLRRHRRAGSGADPALSVLHVAQPTDGGVARYVAEAAADQQARGWSVVVACPDGGWLAGELGRRGIRQVRWNARRSPGPTVLAETVRLRRIVRRVAPDLVHLHSAKAGLAGRLALRGARPTLFQPHGWSWLAATGRLATLSKEWEKRAARWADRIVCVGDGEAELARTDGVGGGLIVSDDTQAGPGEVRQADAAGRVGLLQVVRNGVNPLRFRYAGGAEKRKARAALTLDPTAPLVVCPARWARQKGQDVLVAAWPAVRAQCPAAQLVLLGGDAPADLDLPEGACLVGNLTDVWPWLAAADVVVLPSRWEGLSLALLEAMAVGRPTIVSDIPGLAKVVDNGLEIRVPVGDVDALAAALTQRLLKPGSYKEGALAAVQAAYALDEIETLDTLATLTAAVVADRARGTG